MRSCWLFKKRVPCDHKGFGCASVVYIEEEYYKEGHDWTIEMFGHMRNKSVGVLWCLQCGELMEIEHRLPTRADKRAWRENYDTERKCPQEWFHDYPFASTIGV